MHTQPSSIVRCLSRLGARVVAVVAAVALHPPDGAASTVHALDGPGWLLATDPQNVGRDQQWWNAPRPEAKPARVPWIIQDTFPGYHGVAWYWRDFMIPARPAAEGRVLVRFWAVDYQAQVWLNGQLAGAHEGGESPFVFDITSVVRHDATNRLAVRVLNPTHEPIDGIVLNQTPHRNKALPYTAGSAWNQGGIIDSVELLVTPSLRVNELFVRPDWRTGAVRVQGWVHNAASNAVSARLEVSLAPAAAGETLVIERLDRTLAPGDTEVEARLRVVQPRLWELNDPFLYRATLRVWSGDAGAPDERSVRCGFRDFRFENGCFRLNGRRLYLRCSHTGNCCPIGLELPHDPDLLRRDLLNVKVMGFNAIRFISGVAKRYQLDLCDEIGLLVYEEAYGGWCLADSPRMAERFDESILGMIRRDRNHPSVAIWGLLNETSDGPVFRHAVAVLPRVRELDDTRLVLLNSGRFDEPPGGGLAGLESWRTAAGPDPNVTHNPLTAPLTAPWAVWEPGRLAFHPGPAGEFSVVRWTAPEPGGYAVAARFLGPGNTPSTDVHVLHNGRAIFDDWLNLHGRGNAAEHRGSLELRPGDTVDFVVGVGNGNYGGDTTALEATLRRLPDGKVFNAAAEFSRAQNPGPAWSYGTLAPGPKPDAATFRLYPHAETSGGATRIGSLSNPGAAAWEDVLSDQHPYQRVPHTANIIRTLRTLAGGGHPVFLSEYGVGSAVDLVRATRHYERLGATHADDARFYRDKLDRFLADWDRWRMAEVFGRPEDFFAASLARMAGQRLLGINAIRANPNVAGYSLTGTVDQGMSGEGLFTTFRELKPGTVDAVFDGLAPLRWCLFAEPVHIYRGAKVRLEAVLANEDMLGPGSYPVRLQVFGPANQPVWVCETNLTISAEAAGRERPFALPVFAGDVVIDGPAGEYRWVAALDRGGAPAGGLGTFHVANPAQLPPVESDIALWGDDPVVAAWLDARGIRHHQSADGESRAREVILAGASAPAPGGAPVFQALAKRVADGATVVFISPALFAPEASRAAFLPAGPRVALGRLNTWLYHKDDWARPHPIFEGLPTGLLDYTFYRELIPDEAWIGQEQPGEVVAAANDASLAYASGVLLSVQPMGEGRFVLNTLRIREHLGRLPAADRLLINLLRFAANSPGEPHLSGAATGQR